MVPSFLKDQDEGEGTGAGDALSDANKFGVLKRCQDVVASMATMNKSADVRGLAEQLLSIFKIGI